MSSHIICGHFVVICASFMDSLCVEFVLSHKSRTVLRPLIDVLCQITNIVCEPFIHRCHVQVFDQYTLQLKTDLLTGVVACRK